MADRVIRDGEDLARWIAFLGQHPLPMTASAIKGASKTLRQNKTIFMWYKEISEQRGDTDQEEVRAECKLHFGVPILRRDGPAFREEYDEMIKPLPYPAKLRLIRLFDWPVTRRMTTKQAAEYQDTILHQFTSQGFELTVPDSERAA